MLLLLAKMYPTLIHPVMSNTLSICKFYRVKNIGHNDDLYIQTFLFQNKNNSTRFLSRTLEIKKVFVFLRNATYLSVK